MRLRMCLLLLLLFVSITCSCELLAKPIQVIDEKGHSKTFDVKQPMAALPTASIIEKAIELQSELIKEHHLIASPLLAPSDGEFTLGKVTRHRVEHSHLPSQALFVVGIDRISIAWIQRNLSYLKKIHAIGILANRQSLADIRALSRASGLAILPGQLQNFSSIVGTHHYPFLLYRGWVVQ